MSGCKHERVISISAKHSDRCFTTFPDGSKKDGYGIVPGVSEGDYAEFDICIDCCVITTTSSKRLQECFDMYRRPDDGTPKAKALELLEMMLEKQRTKKGGWGPPPMLDGMTDDEYYLVLNVEDPGEVECWSQQDFDAIDEMYERYREFV